MEEKTRDKNTGWRKEQSAKRADGGKKSRVHNGGKTSVINWFV